MITLNIRIENDAGFQTWWKNVCDYCWDDIIREFGTHARSHEHFVDRVTALLKKFNARQLPGNLYLQFQTDEDASLFLLKWS